MPAPTPTAPDDAPPFVLTRRRINLVFPALIAGTGLVARGEAVGEDDVGRRDDDRLTV